MATLTDLLRTAKSISKGRPLTELMMTEIIRGLWWRPDQTVRMMDPATFEKISPQGYLHGDYFSFITLDNGKTLIIPNVSQIVNTVINEIPQGNSDGNNTEFTVSNTPNIYTLRVYLNGIRQHPDDYTVTDSTIIFDTPPYEGDIVQVFYEVYVPDQVVSGEVPTGSIDGANKDFTLVDTPDPASVNVYLNGVLQNHNEYSVAGDVITMTEAPYVGDYLIIDYKTTSAAANGTYNQIPAGSINGTNKDFTLPEAPTAVKVYLNGVRQLEGTHYTLAGDTITFAEAPYLGDWVLIDYEL